MPGPEAERHLREEEVERYSRGDVSDEELARWDEHLLVCESCRRQVSESDEYVAAMRGAGAEIRGRERRRRRFLPALVAVAAALGLLGVLAIVLLPYIGPAPAAFAVHLTATRGPAIEARAPARTPLTLEPDLTGLPPAGSPALEVVDSAGKAVWRGALADGRASIPQLSPGLYFVRVYSSGELRREYGLQVENTH